MQEVIVKELDKLSNAGKIVDYIDILALRHEAIADFESRIFAQG